MLITSLLIRHSLARLHRARSDNSPAFPFYGPASLGLKEQPFSFRSGPWLLRGSFYWKGDAFPEKPLVVFFHGLGGGRIAYLRLIAAYAEEGYAIASFDNTGCGESEGPCIYGLGHVLKDVRSFFGWLRSQNKYGPFPFVYSVGHSWGGFASLLSTGEPEVKKAVSFAGFLSYSDIVLKYFPKRLQGMLRPAVRLALLLDGGRFGNPSAGKVVSSSLAKVLYIQGTEDEMVPPSCGITRIEKLGICQGRVRTVAVPCMGHQPYLAREAERHYMDCLKRGEGSLHEKEGGPMNLELATRLDPAVMKVSFDFLKE